MQDIHSRYTSPTRPIHPVPDVKLELPSASDLTPIERALAKVNHIAGRITGYDRVYRPLEISEAVHESITKPKKRKMPRGVLTKAGRKAKSALAIAKEEIKKPGRRTALVQSVAMGALFALFAGNISSTGALSLAPSSNQPARRYLPNIVSTANLAPLNQKEATTAHGLTIGLYGWVTPWNIDSGTPTAYNGTSAFWGTLNADGVTVDPKADWASWQTYKEKNKLADTYLTVSADPNFSYIPLTNLDKQGKHIDTLLNLVQNQGFNGVDIDYEGLGSDNRELFNNFIRNLTTAFHQKGKRVAVTVEARIGNQVPMDWHTVGQLADEVRIMAYDYHSRNTSQPGPVAPLAWVAEVASYAVQQIDKTKVVIGLGNYGYDWQEPALSGASWTGIGLSYDGALKISNDNKAPITHQTGIDDRGYDIGTVPYYSYTDAQGHVHQVWFEDAISLQEKIDSVANYQVKGVMFWSAGAGDPALLK